MSRLGFFLSLLGVVLAAPIAPTAAESPRIELGASLLRDACEAAEVKRDSDAQTLCFFVIQTAIGMEAAAANRGARPRFCAVDAVAPETAALHFLVSHASAQYEPATAAIVRALSALYPCKG